MKYAIGLAAAVILGFLCSSCASQQAGIMAVNAQSELAVYAANADAKVHQAEDARLELELRLLELDIAALLNNPALDAADTSKRIVAQVKSHIDARDARLQVWADAQVSAAHVRALLEALRAYHTTGVNEDQLVRALTELETRLKGAAANASRPTLPTQ